MLVNLREVSIKDLITMMKEKNFSGIRKWVGENLDNDQSDVFRKLYDTSTEFLSNKESEAHMILILAKYQYQSSFAAYQEINLMACLTEMMIELEYS